ncbi:MAG: hypothetical protein HUJ91_00775 [Bacteroidales bacterium]|nr:hypothetical protein [Bacteroidales bacterium]
MKNKIFALSALTALTLTGCYADKGNYDYDEVTPITIEGIEEAYSVYSYEETLEIVPTIKGANESEMEYKWVLWSETSNSEEENVISTERNLSYPVNDAPGSYYLFYEVLHKPTGLTRSTSAKLTFVTRFSRGWYVLKEESGNTELDLYTSEGEINGGLLTKVLKAPLEGKPISLSLMPDYSYIDRATDEISYNNCLALVSDQNIWMISANAMTMVYDKSDLFYEEIPGINFYNTSRVYFGQVVLTDQGCFYTMSAPPYSLGSGKMGLPEGAGASRFDYYSQTLTALVYYSNETHSLQSCDYNGYAHDFLSAEANDIPGECLMLSNYYNSVNGEYAYLLMKENGNIVLYVFDTGKTQKYNAPLVKKHVFDASSKIYSASSYTANRGAVRFLYYTVGDKLYSFDIETLTEKDITPAGVSGENFVYVSHRKWSYASDAGNTFEYLVLASQKGDNYTVRMYGLLGGTPDGSAKIEFSGTGKFADIEYLSPKMNADYFNGSVYYY